MTTIGTAMLAVVALMAAAPAWAGGPFDGRWATDLQACGGEKAETPLLTVDPLALRWREAACAIRTSYRVHQAWHISARCWGEGAISDVPIRLQMRGDRLVLDWGRARPEELRRCP
jgi:hypothetical protein